MAQPERGGSSRLAALLCPAAAGKGHAAVGCEASDATVRIGCAADSAGVWCWLAAALAQPEWGAGRPLSRLASLLHSAAAGVGDSVTPWGMSCLRVGSVAILCPVLCRVWRRSGGGTIATAGRTRGGSSRPAVLSAQSACIVKRKGSTMLALSTASGCYVLIF